LAAKVATMKIESLGSIMGGIGMRFFLRIDGCYFMGIWEKPT